MTSCPTLALVAAFSKASVLLESHCCVSLPQYHDFGVEGGELWLATSSDRRVSVWASDWLKDKCELLDWLSFPAPAGPKVSECGFCQPLPARDALRL